jgi:hypothetical protein
MGTSTHCTRFYDGILQSSLITYRHFNIHGKTLEQKHGAETQDRRRRNTISREGKPYPTIDGR